jgi:DmsE family decaheme c-type cytochrome
MHFRRHGNSVWIVAGTFALVMAIGCLVVAASDGPSAPASGAGPVVEYVGADTCKTCHEEIYTNWARTAHYKTLLKEQPGAQGCEACHGAGAEHVNGVGDKSKIFSFKTVSAKDVSDRCLNCHSGDDARHNFRRSEHNKSNVSCTDCHSVHHAEGRGEMLLVKAQPQLCYSCHAGVKPDFSKPFHHRVNEGMVTCSDCHEPHGSARGRSLRATSAKDTVCFNCHTDKAGPFSFEHAVIKAEGCSACRTPHGSSNPRLLTRSQVGLLCTECHTATVGVSAPGVPSFHNQAQKYQACTLCHAAVHGSNTDRWLFKP